ncbi:hypothetical protein Ddye_008302, partial [Dipteronia dyeriana]
LTSSGYRIGCGSGCQMDQREKYPQIRCGSFIRRNLNFNKEVEMRGCSICAKED